MSLSGGNPNVILVESIPLNGYGRMVIPRTVRKILGVENDGSVTLTLLSDKTAQIRKEERK